MEGRIAPLQTMGYVFHLAGFPLPIFMRVLIDAESRSLIDRQRVVWIACLKDVSRCLA